MNIFEFGGLSMDEFWVESTLAASSDNEWKSSSPLP